MKAKQLIAALLASCGTHALAETISVSSVDLEKYETIEGRQGFSKQLFANGILLPSEKAEVFVLDVKAAAALTDEQLIAVAGDFVTWLSGQRTKWETRRWEDMTLASQDIRGAD